MGNGLLGTDKHLCKDVACLSFVPCSRAHVGRCFRRTQAVSLLV